MWWAVEQVDAAEAGGVAVVVGNHNRGIEALEVQHHHRLCVESGMGNGCV